MKTLYVDIDEEISELIKKLSALKGNQILLVVPKGAIVFKNQINLKLIKKNAEEGGKEILVFTNDEKGKSMLKKVGLKLYQGHLRKRKSTKSTQLGKLPIKEVKRQLYKKVSITDVSSRARIKKSKAAQSSPQKKLQRKEQKEWVRFFIFNTLKKKTVVTFAAFTIFFFAIVLYVAIPSATIYLTPSSNILEATANITFADREANEKLLRLPNSHVIESIPLRIDFDKSILYKPTGKVFTGESARCNLKITNKRSSAWTLIPKTRFQDNSGVVYRIKQRIEVPGSHFELIRDEDGNVTREKVPGTLIVNVEADEKDENGNIIGARGNLIAGTRFFLPGLSKFNQGLMNASNEKACRGGVTEFYAIVTEDDIKAAGQKIIDEMESAAKQYLLDFVDGENLKRAQFEEEDGVLASQILLFDDHGAIHYEMLETKIPEGILDKRVDEFSVAGKMTVRGVAYEEQNYNEILEQGLLSRVHPDKVLSSIDFDSITYNIVRSDSELDDLTKIKISVAVRGIEEYNFDPHSEKGKALIDRILQYVPGKLSKEANYFMSNLEEIKFAKIVIWPFWKNTLPERESSITIKVQ